jgi:hypothetical protein
MLMGCFYYRQGKELLIILIKKMIYTLAELNTISSNMERYGGGFASSLAVAMVKADQDNLRRIVQAFPELMDKYLKL